MIAKKILILVFSGLLVASCCPKKPKAKLPTVLPKDTMSMVLEDMELIEAGLNTMSNQGTDVRPLINPYYNKLMEKYHIDSTRIRASFDYYVGKPEILDKIYQQTLDEVVQKQSKNQYGK